MAIGVVGRKAGMTRVFTDAGETIPVTVIEVLPNRVTQVKSQEKDGYRAVQVTYGTAPAAAVFQGGHRPLRQGQCGARAGPGGISPGRRRQGANLKPGAEVKVDLFKAGESVDVTGTTIGKGFAGVMKRHNFGGLPATHGVSVSHRSPGSIGQRQTPGRVFKGRRMSGHMGVVRRTIENLKVVQVDARAQSPPHPRRGAGGRGRPGHRAPVAEGRAPGAAQDRRADQGRLGAVGQTR